MKGTSQVVAELDTMMEQSNTVSLCTLFVLFGDCCVTPFNDRHLSEGWVCAFYALVGLDDGVHAINDGQN